MEGNRYQPGRLPGEVVQPMVDLRCNHPGQWAGQAGVAGSVLGVVAWLFGVVMALPIFLLRFFGTELSLGHVDAFTLVGFAVAGGALGSTYVVVARRLSDGSTRQQDTFSLQR